MKNDDAGWPALAYGWRLPAGSRWKDLACRPAPIGHLVASWSGSMPAAVAFILFAISIK